MNSINKKTKIFIFYIQLIFCVAASIFIFNFYATILGIWNGTENNENIFGNTAKACENEYNKTYSWYYGSKEWSINLEIPYDIYTFYKCYGDKSPDINYQMAEFITSDEPVVLKIANTIDKLTDNAGFDYYNKVNFVLSFIQSLELTSDKITTSSYEYWRYPVETLIDGGGDCEDKSVLFASIIEAMGYDAVLIDLQDHIAVGVAGNDFYGFYYLFENVKYYFCETTGQGWVLGEFPSDLKDRKASIIQIGFCGQSYQLSLGGQ